MPHSCVKDSSCFCNVLQLWEEREASSLGADNSIVLLLNTSHYFFHYSSFQEINVPTCLYFKTETHTHMFSTLMLLLFENKDKI